MSYRCHVILHPNIICNIFLLISGQQKHCRGCIWAGGGGVFLYGSQHFQAGPLAHTVPHQETPPPQLDQHPVYGPHENISEMVI